MDHSGVVDRKALQRALLRDVLAKRGKYPALVERVFMESFPSVHKVIRAINSDDHASLIRLLQRAESWLVIGMVAPRLLGRIRTLSLHDALFAARGDVSGVADAFREVWGELGCHLATKVE